MFSENAKQQLDQYLHSAKAYLTKLFTLGNNRLQTSFTNHPLKNNLIGLEINSEFVKILQLKMSDNQHTVTDFAIAVPPPGSVIKDEIKDCPAIASLLRDKFAELNLSSKNIALAIPRSSAIVKNITVNKRLTDDEIESRVWSEANRLFPNLIGDIYLDFAVVGPAPQEPEQLEILLIACRKEQIKPYLEVMRLADLNPSIVDLNSYALERALTLIAKQATTVKTIALLNVNFSLISIVVMNENNLIYTHELSYDSSHTQAETEELPSLNTTDELKPQPSTESDNNAVWRNNLSLHIRHILQFFYSSRPNIRIEKLMISGDCVAKIPNLAQFIQSEVGKETEAADPFKNMKIEASVDQTKLSQYAPTFMLCCGLALSKLN